MIDVTEILAHDGQPTATVFVHFRSHSVRNLLLKCQRARRSAKLPCPGSAWHLLQEADDQRCGHIKREISDDVNFRSAVIPVDLFWFGKYLAHVKVQNIPMVDVQFALRGSVKHLSNKTQKKVIKFYNTVFQIEIKLYRTVGLNLVKSIGHFDLSSQKV